MKRLFYLFFTLLVVYLGFTDLCCCTRGSQWRRQQIHDIVNSSRAIKVYIRPEIDQRYISLIQESLGRFNVLPGIRVAIVEDVSRADVIVYSWNNRINDNIIGLQPESSNQILLDIRRITEAGGDRALQTVFMHELGHWLGMKHVCQHRNERRECSPVGYGWAIMNPVVENGFVTEFTTLDISEFRRIMRF